MIKTLTKVNRLLGNTFLHFSQQTKITKQRFNLIKNHSLVHEYHNLEPAMKIHGENNWRVIEDETKIRFLVEEGGFPGCSDMGILFNIGTQVENEQNSGSHFCLKNLVHMKPEFAQSIKNYEFLNQTGATVDFNYDVESAYLKCSFFEEDIDTMVNLLLDLALRQKKLFQESFQTDSGVEDINELVRITAFGGKGIGMPSNGLGQVLTNQDFINFQRKFITPHRTIISLSNVKNTDKVIESIKEKIKEKYSQFLSRKAPIIPISYYTGGTSRLINNFTPNFDFAVAFPGAHSKSPKMQLYNILRVILGSASSFSSGGPGKGMHSRCTKNMLNKQRCIDSASFILSHYEHYGMFGLTASGANQDAEEVIDIVIRQLLLLKEISEGELERVKNMLVASIYANIQRQSDRLQELTKHVKYVWIQMNNYNRIKLLEFQENIRRVTIKDIGDELENMFKLPPTFVLRGDEKAIKVGKEVQWRKKLGIK